MTYRAALIVALSLGFTSVAEARSQRVQQIPNGEIFSCTTCHDATFPTGAQDGARNAFGQQVEANLTGGGAVSAQEVDWPAIYDLDADGDGFTNGEELGDPDGVWSEGANPPESYDPSNPADADDTPDIGGGEDAGGGDDAGGPSMDAGSSDDAGMTADTGGTEDPGGNDDGGSSDEGCSSTGTADPLSTGALVALFGLGLAALRRRFS